MHLRAGLLLLLLATTSFTTACSQATADGEDTESSEANLSNDQDGIDVQVLQVWTPGRAFPIAPHGWQGPQPSDVSMNAADPTNAACTTLRTSTSQGTGTTYENREVDCTKAFAKAAPFDVTNQPGPVITPVRFQLTKRVSDGYIFADPDFCNRVELRVVLRNAAASQPSFAGVGFHSSRGDSFTPKSELQAVGNVTLRNGDAATVYRFTGLSTCISSAHSSTSGNSYQTFSFKPYAAYDANGSRFRVWEDIRGNHTIGRSWPGSTPQINALAFDRQNDLLAH